MEKLIDGDSIKGFMLVCLIVVAVSGFISSCQTQHELEIVTIDRDHLWEKLHDRPYKRDFSIMRHNMGNGYQITIEYIGGDENGKTE